MDAQSKSTPARRTRKSKSVSVVPNVVANIVFIPPYIRKTQALSDWYKAFSAYVKTLSNDEQTLVKKCIAFTIAKPVNREYLHGACPVIPFPSAKLTQSKSAMEAKS